MLIAPCLALLALLTQQQTQQQTESPDPLVFEALGPSGVMARFDQLPKLGEVSLWLSVAVGSAHDPVGQAGMARVLAEVLRSELPAPGETRPQELVVLPGYTLIGVTVPRAGAQQELQRFAAWLDGELQLDDDAILRARGRALLRADDELSILPGPVLRGRALRAMFGEHPAARPAGGWPEQVRRLSPDQIRARLSEHWVPQRASLLVVGAGAEELRPAAVGFLGALEAREAPELSVESGPAQAILTVGQHSRVDAPFVLLAIRAPGLEDEPFPAFVLAMEVARNRAGQRFAGTRGGELAAEFPVFAYQLEDMPLLAFVERRGEDGDPLEQTLGELQRFAAEQRRHPPSSAELDTARLSLANRLRIPPYTDRELATMRRFPSFLHQRAGLLIRYRLHGWPADLVDQLSVAPAEAVADALQGAFPADGMPWFGLRPRPGAGSERAEGAVAPEPGGRVGSGSG